MSKSTKNSNKIKSPGNNNAPLFTSLFSFSTSLLGSSCCIIQLILNSLSLPCAGFSLLTPYRPIFATILTLTSGYHLLNHSPKKSLLIVLFSWLVFFSPEFVRYWNTGSIGESVIEVVKLELDKVKCDSCANKAKNQLEAAPFVLSATVQHIEGTTTGRAVVYLTSAGVDESELGKLLKEASISSLYERTLFSSPVSNGTNSESIPCISFSVTRMGCGSCMKTLNEHLITSSDVTYVTTSIADQTSKVCGVNVHKGMALPSLPSKFKLQEL